MRMVTIYRVPLKMKVDIFNTDRKYKTIYADPPWMERGVENISVELTTIIL